jgi:cobalt/nickel transport system ATP-binding protein
MTLSPKTLTEIRKRVGMVFQDPDEQLFMPSVLEDVSFGPLTAGIGAAEAERLGRQALAQVGLEGKESKAPFHLSAGEKRRAALAGVLSMRPDVLVLDEPTTYLDPPGQHSLLRLLESLPPAKILVTHDVHFARALAGRAVFFQKGRIVESGPVDSVVARHTWEPPGASDAKLRLDEIS